MITQDEILNIVATIEQFEEYLGTVGEYPDDETFWAEQSTLEARKWVNQHLAHAPMHIRQLHIESISERVWEQHFS